MWPDPYLSTSGGRQDWRRFSSLLLGTFFWLDRNSGGVPDPTRVCRLLNKDWEVLFHVASETTLLCKLPVFLGFYDADSWNIRIHIFMWATLRGWFHRCNISYHRQITTVLEWFTHLLLRIVLIISVRLLFNIPANLLLLQWVTALPYRRLHSPRH